MSIFQFLRIVWARWRLIAWMTAACLVGALIVTLIFPPRWEAHSRIMLNLLKPDPVTGQIIAGPATMAYVATQTELIQDYTVAGQVADQLGWLSDPQLINQYQQRSKRDVRDFRHWLAQIVIDRTKVKMLQDSNILEITYSGNSADEAKRVADALRQAYVNASLNFKRDEATRNADWYEAQAAKAKGALDAAEKVKMDYERQNGIAMADDTTDVDSAHLRALAAQGVTAPAMVAPAVSNSPGSIQLAQLDAQIAQASKTLGPNHPELQALQQQRASLAREVGQEQAQAREATRAAAGAAAASAGALERAVQAQKSRVVAEGDKLGHLTQLQNVVNLRRDEFNKASANAAQQREEAAVADTGLTPLASAVTPKDPSFPNMLLIIPGALFLGLIMGVMTALLAELFHRRVRSVEDLESVLGVAPLAVIAAPRRPSGRRRGVLGARRLALGHTKRPASA